MNTMHKQQTLEDQQAAVLQLQESSAARFEEYAIQKDVLAFQLAEQEQLVGQTGGTDVPKPH